MQNIDVPMGDRKIAQLLVSPTSETSTALHSAIGEFQASTNQVGWDIIPVVGQSNALGRGIAIDTAYLDGPDSRVFQFGNLSSAYADQVVAAKDPLFHEELPGQTVGFALSFAKLYAATLPTHRRVLLVPCAHGNTGFGSTGSYTWRVGQTGPINLYTLSIEQINKALALPGENRIATILWHQGEANSTSSASTYRTDLDNLIRDLRTRYGSTVPFVMGQMSPLRIAANAGYAAIDAVHLDTPNRQEYIGFWKAVSLLEADDLHFNATGQRYNGQSAFNAYAVALNSRGGVVEATHIPVPRAILGLATNSATSTSANLSWTRSDLSSTYTVRYRKVGDTAWLQSPAITTTTTAVSDLVPATSYEFQVAGVNVTGTGTFSQTVTTSTGIVVPGFSDMFTRSGSSLGSTDNGKAWFVRDTGTNISSWTTDGSTAKYGGGVVRSLALVDGGSANGTVSVTIGSIGLAVGGLVARGTDASNYIAVLPRQSLGVNRLQLVKRVAGTQTLIGTSPSGKVSADGSLIEIVLNGPLVSVKLDGVEVIAPITVSEFETVKNHGLFGDASDLTTTYASAVFTAS